MNEKNNHEATALTWASEKSHEAIARRLLENGAHVDEVNEKGHTVQSVAAWCGHEAIVHLLLENGANATRRFTDAAGIIAPTALHQAA